MPFDKLAYMRAYGKKWYKKNKARLDKKNRAYAVNNAAVIREYKRNWFLENKMRLGEKEAILHARNPLKRKRQALKHTYGLTLEQYQEMVVQQNGVCAICGVRPAKRALDVDHNHETKKIRGLLCSNCNRGLGMFQEKIDILQKAQIYLQKDQNYGY